MALGYRPANASVYLGGDFDIAGAGPAQGRQRQQGHRCAHRLEHRRRRRVEALEISPDQQNVYIGGSFDNVGSAAHNALARTDANTGAVAPVVFSRASLPGSGLIQGRVFSIAIGTDNVTPYVAIGPARPGGTNGGNKFASYNPSTGASVWEQNGP